MLNLVKNNCIEFISMDPESGGHAGDIYFCGEEVYTGEIFKDEPVGKGTLKMYEKSEFEGKFDSNQIVEGTFTHFSGLTFTGKFNKDRFYKGTIRFVDGDKLEGEWGNEDDLWTLKNGELFDEQDIVVYKFDSNNRQGSSKHKVIKACKEKVGFTIEFKHYLSGGVTIKELVITSNGSCTFQVFKDNVHIQTKEYNFGKIPFEKEENFENGELKDSKYCFCLEKKLKLIKQASDQEWYLEFKLLEGVEGKGKIDFDRQKVGFKGKLLIEDEEDDIEQNFEFQYDMYQNLHINLGDKKFETYQEMYKYLEDTYEEVEIQSSTRERKSSKCNKPIMKELITEIKKSEECKIF